MNQSNTYISYLEINNVKTLKHVILQNLKPFTVILGKNGSGKTSILETLDFLSTSIQSGLVETCKKRNGLKELTTKDGSKSISITVHLYDDVSNEKIGYTVSISEKNENPYIEKEVLFIPGGRIIMKFENGSGYIETENSREEEVLFSEDIFAIGIYGSISKFNYAETVYSFFKNIRTYDLNIESLRNVLVLKLEENLERNGENLANVLYQCKKNNPELYKTIIEKLQHHIPSLETIETKQNENLSNQVYMIDKGFKEPINRNYISSGTLKMLAYYLLLTKPSDLSLMGIEEPENGIYPAFISELAEACRITSENLQVFVTTHSPYFVNNMEPNEVWLCTRDKSGFSNCVNVSEIEGIETYIKKGAKLGHLWTEGFLRD
ncbi:MAG: AAA family ATPase [Caldisericia bacterium]|nr:AAA family ATPase [Caldisericia bacterium]